MKELIVNQNQRSNILIPPFIAPTCVVQVHVFPPPPCPHPFPTSLRRRGEEGSNYSGVSLAWCDSSPGKGRRASITHRPATG